MSDELRDAISVDFPLRGEWVAYNSPGDRIPSHGTDILGQRFAYDLIRVDRRKGWHVHPAGGWRSNLIGFPVRECYAWGEPVHMPLDGEIVEARDGYPRAQPGGADPRYRDRAEERAHLRHQARPVPVGGQPRHGTDRRCLRRVRPPGSRLGGGVEGQTVRAGDVIGRVGHTGNSTAPHLYFQLMDGPDPRTAMGVACAFREVEFERADGRHKVEDVVPRREDRIRWGGPG